MKPALPVLAGLLHAFFHEWLVEQRNASHRTVLAYRDTWRLFLRFVAARQKRKVSALRTEDLTEVEVLAFLQHIERERRGSIGTRNCRLAAIRSFFSFVADREPRAAKLCAGSAPRSFQTSTEKGDVLPGIRRSSGDPLAAGPINGGRSTGSPRCAFGLP